MPWCATAAHRDNEPATVGHGSPSLPGDENGSVPGNRISIRQYSNLQRSLPKRTLWFAKFEARNPKLETNSKFKYFNVQNRSPGPCFWSFEF